MSKNKKENELLVDQPLLHMRVIKTVKGEYDIEVAMLDGPSIGTVEPQEFQAKAISQGLLTAYVAKLKELQEEMLEALTKLSDEKRKEDASSEYQSEEHTDKSHK